MSAFFLLGLLSSCVLALEKPTLLDDSGHVICKSDDECDGGYACVYSSCYSRCEWEDECKQGYSCCFGDDWSTYSTYDAKPCPQKRANECLLDSEFSR